MTRISLKEQYDNSSVIKQLADLTDQIVDYDERITEATDTANAAKTTADTAKTTADSAVAKNTEQDAKIVNIETVNTAQEQEIAGIKLKDAQQDTSIAAIQSKDDEQDTKIAAIQSKDSEQDAKIALIQAKDAEQDLSISSILDTDTKQDAAIDSLKTITNTLTNEVINSVNVVDGTQNGSIMVRLADVGGRVISSPSYPWGQVATFALKQGSEAGYVRGVLTLSDGEVIESNDFQILQIVESDVYVTSITLTPYPTEGKMGGEIGYSNGNTAQINVIDVPTAPGVTSNINDLLQRMGVAEQSINELDVRVTAIENIPGVGAFTNTSRGTILGSAEDGKVSANEDGTGSVSGWSDVVKSAQISDMLTKTDAASTYLTKTDAAATYESIEDAAQIESMANDAQNKANGCFNSVAVNTAGDGLTFKTPGDDQVDVAIPTGTDNVGFIYTTRSGTTSSDSSNVYQTDIIFGVRCGANTVVTKNPVLSISSVLTVDGSPCKGALFSVPAQTPLGNMGPSVVKKTFNTVDLDTDFRTKLSAVLKESGVYSVFIAVGGIRNDGFVYNKVTSSVEKIEYTVDEDGNLTLTDTSSTKSLHHESNGAGCCVIGIIKES